MAVEKVAEKAVLAVVQVEWIKWCGSQWSGDLIFVIIFAEFGG